MRQKTNITLHPSVKKAAMQIAQEEGRSLSEIIERLLEREVATRKKPVDVLPYVAPTPAPSTRSTRLYTLPSEEGSLRVAEEPSFGTSEKRSGRSKPALKKAGSKL